jgi:imidazole glycerol phosphate synthase glutamine amidotransferase subunit
MSEVLIVRTGTANTASVMAAFERLGCGPRLCTEPEEILEAPRVVVPGVGTFAAARDALGSLAARVQERICAGRPTLSICLGMQLLAEGSDESPGARGLAILPGHARRFAPGVRIPQLGWNRVDAGDGCRMLESGEAYYANSYRLDPVVPRGWAMAQTHHGEDFLAACERGPVLACQFHPELSGPWGMRLLQRWLDAASRWEAQAC